MRRYLVALALAAMTLSGCLLDDSTERCATAPNPLQCEQVVQAGGNVDDYLLYGMAGYMLSSAINGAGQRQPVLVADPHWHGPRRPIASYAASAGYVHRSTTVVTTTKRGLLGGTRTTTRTSTVVSRPSYGSYRATSYRSTSYRSSYSARRR